VVYLGTVGERARPDENHKYAEGHGNGADVLPLVTG
jgi:hypothetical protein